MAPPHRPDIRSARAGRDRGWVPLVDDEVGWEAMSEKPVLAAIRELLKFKDSATITETAKIAGVTPRRALEVINRNGKFVWRNRNTGRITKVDPRTQLREQLWKAGRFWKEEVYDYDSTKGLCFENKELFDRLSVGTYGGGLGDSYSYRYVPITDENIAILRESGMVPAAEITIDDQLWDESNA